MHLEVQVRAGRVPGRALVADLLAGGDLLSDRDRDRGHVAVVGEVAVAVVDQHRVAVPAFDRRARRCRHRLRGSGCRRGGQVDAGVQATPALAEARGDPAAGMGCTQGVTVTTGGGWAFLLLGAGELEGRRAAPELPVAAGFGTKADSGAGLVSVGADAY